MCGVGEANPIMEVEPKPIPVAPVAPAIAVFVVGTVVVAVDDLSWGDIIIIMGVEERCERSGEKVDDLGCC